MLFRRRLTSQGEKSRTFLSNFLFIYSCEYCTNSKISTIVDQNTCRADYVLSVVAIYSYLSGKKNLYSAQDAIDCDTENDGCKGGNPFNTIAYFQENGLSDGNAYKYIAKNQTCQKAKYPSKDTANDFEPCGFLIDGKEYDVEFMRIVLNENGPFVAFMSEFFIDLVVEIITVEFSQTSTRNRRLSTATNQESSQTLLAPATLQKVINLW